MINKVQPKDNLSRKNIIGYWKAPDFHDMIDESKNANEQKIIESTTSAYNNGYKAGYKDAEKEYLNKQCIISERINILASNIEKRFAMLEEDESQKLVEVIKLIIYKICKKELSDSTGTLNRMIVELIGMLPSCYDNITVQLNKSDVELLSSGLSGIDSTLSYSIEEDDNLLPGDCQITTQNSFIDARLKQVIDKYFDDI